MGILFVYFLLYVFIAKRFYALAMRRKRRRLRSHTHTHTMPVLHAYGM